MAYLNLKNIVSEYGAINLRFFITENRQMGMFMNPFGGRREYKITEERDKISDNYKIELELVEPHSIDPRIPTEFQNMFNRTRYYIGDLERLLDRSDDFELYVLVDHDNKYQRLG